MLVKVWQNGLIKPETEINTMSKSEIEAMHRSSCAICLIENKSNCAACPWQKYYAETHPISNTASTSNLTLTQN